MFLCAEADKKKNLYASKLEIGALSCKEKENQQQQQQQRKKQLPYLQHFYFSYLEVILFIFFKTLKVFVKHFTRSRDTAILSQTKTCSFREYIFNVYSWYKWWNIKVCDFFSGVIL